MEIPLKHFRLGFAALIVTTTGPAWSQPVTECEVGLSVTINSNQRGVIKSEARPGMCMVQLEGGGDVTVAYVQQLTRTADIDGAGAVVAMGPWDCTDPGGVADAFRFEILEGGRYRDPYGGEGSFIRQDATAILFNQGPFNTIIATVDGATLRLSPPWADAVMVCAPG
jgi:hypothetical protein